MSTAVIVVIVIVKDSWVDLNTRVILLFVIPGSSSDSEDEGKDEALSAKSFLKKKPEPASEASKFLKSAKGSGVRRQDTADPQRGLCSN